MADVFNSDSAPTGVDQLVGEGKKFKTVEDLVKGYQASQEHIGKIEGENATYRQEASTRETVEQQLERYRQESRNAPNGDGQDNTRRDPEPKAPDVDLDTRIRDVLKNTTESERRNRNLQEVADTLTNLYNGDETKANEAVRRKAAEVGMSVSDLQDIASRSPKAAYELFGVEKQNPRPESTAPRGNVNTQGLGGSQIREGTYEFYDKMRRENPGLYNQPHVQAQRMKDAKTLGDAFFPDTR